MNLSIHKISFTAISEVYGHTRGEIQLVCPYADKFTTEIFLKYVNNLSLNILKANLQSNYYYAFVYQFLANLNNELVILAIFDGQLNEDYMYNFQIEEDKVEAFNG